jgi:hypothetical protein
MSLLTAEDEVLQWLRNAEHLQRVTFHFLEENIDKCIRHLPHFLEKVVVRHSNFTGSSLEIAHLASITNLKVSIDHLKTSFDVRWHAFKMNLMKLLESA